MRRKQVCRIAFTFCLILALPLLTPAQSAQQQTKPADMNSYWDKLLQETIPSAPPDLALTAPQEPVTRRAAADFLNHFFFESRTEYLRQEISFSGRPTPERVINAPFSSFLLNPTGIPFPDSFQPNSDQIFHFMNWGTREWLSPRLNTNFSFRYRQDLSHVTESSPALSILNTFPSTRRLELLTGSVEIRGLPTDGAFSGTSLVLGRQYTYGAEIAAFDGATFNVNRRRYSLSVFGGRRFTYFSDPDQRAIGGVNLAVRLTDNATVEYEGLAYIKGSHNIVFRDKLSQNWFFSTYLRVVGGSAVDYNAQVLFTPRNGRTAVRGSFFQKLSDKDYTFDYTILARDRDEYIKGPHLFFGPIQRYSQGAFDVRHEITPQVRVGGAVWLRRLNDSNHQGPYDTSFQDYRINAQVFAPLRLEPFIQLHQRNTDRSSPLGVTDFDDVSRAGETRVQDIQLELRRVFGEGRLALRGGGFYRRFNFQDRFFYINNASVRGLIGGVQLKVDDRTRLYLDYSLDDDFFIFRPSIQHAQSFRLGMAWRY